MILLMASMKQPLSETEPRPAGNISLLCQAGERYLAGGQYMVAQRLLRQAEAQLWRQRDGAALAKVYLPLLEASRLLRQQACEGVIVISIGDDCILQRRMVEEFSRQRAGTLLLGGNAGDRWVLKMLEKVRYAARKSGYSLEALALLRSGNRWRISSTADPTFAAGLPVRWVQHPSGPEVGNTSNADEIALPPAGIYPPGSAGATLAGESLLAAHELLALKWQSRHPVRARRWAEMDWLRRAMRIDSACEPVLIRLLALAGG